MGSSWRSRVLSLIAVALAVAITPPANGWAHSEVPAVPAPQLGTMRRPLSAMFSSRALTATHDTAASPQSLVAASLPASRAVQVGNTATAFATVINTGSATAIGCSIAPLTSVPAAFSYQTTDPTTNQATGSPNTPVDIAGGAAQTFVFAFTPSAPMPPTEVSLGFGCANAGLAPVTPGLNTLLLSASATPIPDIVALAATLYRDGVVMVPTNLVGPPGVGIFSVATVNLGVGGPITVSADTGTSNLAATVSLCQTNPATGACLAAPAASVTTQINANDTPTFGVFLTAIGPLSFNPATERIFVRFNDTGGATRGATSVAAAPGNVFLPLFSHPPFDGEIPTTNFLDHNIPQEFVDTNGIQITWWGEQASFYDGHQGYDFQLPMGTPVLAVADGRVTFAGLSGSQFCPPLNQNVSVLYVSIRHTGVNAEQFETQFLHLSRVDVHTGDSISAGQQIGLSGNTGCSTGPHLHFQVIRLANTNTGQPAIIDPFGWESTQLDPWAQYPQGAQSLYLWMPGQAPTLYRGGSFPPNGGTPPTGNGSVTITTWRTMGVRDDVNPNNEFVELTLDIRFAPSGVVDLTAFKLRNNGGDIFSFPSGFAIHDGQPVRVYTGPGQNSPTRLFWNLGRGAWNNNGDCIRLIYPGGAVYRISTGGACS